MKFLRTIFVLSILLLLISGVTFAYSLEVGIPGQAAPRASVTFAQYLQYIYQFAMWGVGLSALGMLIWAGIKWIVSGAIDQKSDAKDQIYAALTGLGLVLLSVLILQTVNPKLVGSTLPNPSLPPSQTGDNPINPGPQSATSVTGATARCCYAPGNNPPSTETYQWFTMGENMICEDISRNLTTGPDSSCFEHGAGPKP